MIEKCLHLIHIKRDIVVKLNNFDIEVLNTVRVVSDSCLHCRFCVAVSFDDAWSGELLWICML